MMKILHRGLMISLGLILTLNIWAQDQNELDICRIEGDKIIYRINTGWDRSEMLQLMNQFNLDSTFLQLIRKGIPATLTDSLGWKIKELENGWLEVVQPLPQNDSTLIHVFSDFFLVDPGIFDNPQGADARVEYGVNLFSDTNLFVQQDHQVTLRLQGFGEAKEAYIAGSFNEWSTYGQPMTKTEDGWEVTLKLKPGKYQYKFIVDNNWLTDPNNLQTEQDFEYNQNNIFFVSNYRFVLKDHPTAGQVFLAGNFNDFIPDQLSMQYDQERQVWYLDLYLREGTWYYKYVVDGQWILDPDNPDARPDGKGNMNSVIGIGEPHPFYLPGYLNASEVILTGSFNEWNTEEIFMTKNQNGWIDAYIMAPGIYTYKYIVDGTWTVDPHNPYTSGNGDYVNSVLVIEPNYTFTLSGYPDAREVIVTGTFCDWSHDGYRMIRDGDQWIFPCHLETGKHSYKFIVDGQWILDPDNDLWEENQYGTDNSVIWVE